MDALTWVRFAVWVIVGIGVYLGYSRKRSTIAIQTIDFSTVSADR